MPIQSKGGYQLDFDNLDAINPFQGSSMMGFSPAQPCVGATVRRSTEKAEPEVVEAATVCTPEPEQVQEEVVKADFALDETMPFIASLENSVADTSTNVCSTDSPVIIDPKKLLAPLEDQSMDDATEELPKALSLAAPEPDAKPDTTEELPKALSPAAPEPDAKPDGTGEELPKALSPAAREPETKPEPLAVSESVEEAPLPARGSYSFDFDNLDAINPFQTGGSKIPNSPTLDRKVEPVKSSPPKQDAQKEKSVESDPVVAESVKEAPVAKEVKPAVVEETTATKETSVSQPTPAADGVKLLEFNFDDGTQVKRKPPFKKLGKRPAGAKGSEKKPAPAEQKPVAPAPSAEPEPVPKEDPQDGAPIEAPPKGSYSIDFNMLDDPNFNPFGTKAKMGNSPAAGRQKPPPEQKVDKEAPVTVLPAAPVAKVLPLRNDGKEQPRYS